MWLSTGKEDTAIRSARVMGQLEGSPKGRLPVQQYKPCRHSCEEEGKCSLSVLSASLNSNLGLRNGSLKKCFKTCQDCGTVLEGDLILTICMEVTICIDLQLQIRSALRSAVEALALL
ncbi:hypothetical protein PF010_g11259 [Phytophthora fragariae]|uniref:Uncharacterized protein n=1 Tax=Phytophthora fragariae TaxID=53985 RepID=A0A6A4DIF7_9STRA|nr:hypothetical protein PF010_g11259 [Phytophthora fragariae]KAE9110504.1 hypothetical protein PF007_g11841 [Phytophthora fragariae]KAE9308965.1 hypothetical protein PF001_g10904 [Phytophthora fragariae]KAE9340756.1 hypothetical protein PF008_g10964 [Phytophthora fragariae]